MTEEQAKTKICPFGREAVSPNIEKRINCIASDCMMWEKVHPLTLPEDDPNIKHGYCGLTSKP